MTTSTETLFMAGCEVGVIALWPVEYGCRAMRKLHPAMRDGVILKLGSEGDAGGCVPHERNFLLKAFSTR